MRDPLRLDGLDLVGAWLPLTIQAGDWTLELAFVDEDGEPVDMTGPWSGWAVRSLTDRRPPIMTLSFDLSNAAAGRVLVEFDRDAILDVIPPGAGHWDGEPAGAARYRIEKDRLPLFHGPLRLER